MQRIEHSRPDFELEGETILEQLKDAHVFSVEPTGDGRFCFIEQCDRNFDATLTAEQVIELADELRRMATSDQSSADINP